MAVIKCGMNGAGKQTEYKACCYNEGAASISNTLGFNFTKEQLDGFTSIDITCNASGATTVKYIVDGTSWSSFVAGNTPLTIPSFTTNLVVAITFGQATHQYIEAIATLS